MYPLIFCIVVCFTIIAVLLYKLNEVVKQLDDIIGEKDLEILTYMKASINGEEETHEKLDNMSDSELQQYLNEAIAELQKEQRLKRASIEELEYALLKPEYASVYLNNALRFLKDNA